MIKKIYVLSLVLSLGFSVRALAFPKFLSFGTGYTNDLIFSSQYSSLSLSEALVYGSLSWGLAEHYAIRFSADTTADGQSIFLGAGISYYFTAPEFTSFRTPEGAEVKTNPQWSHYIGGALGINRVQAALTTSAGGQYIVSSALIGPSLYAGTMQSLNDKFYLSYELYFRYSIMGTLGSSALGANVGLTYRLP